MKRKVIYFFIVVALAQLYVPAKMIWDREEVIEGGEVFNFKVAPVDPHDPFRGKYVRLAFEANTFTPAYDETWVSGEEVFVLLVEDSLGFASIQDLLKEAPEKEADYVKAHIRYTSDKQVVIDYPFSRFYMEESKALAAERLYNNVIHDSSKIIYAIVAVRDGEAVLQNVLVNGEPISTVIGLDRD